MQTRELLHASVFVGHGAAVDAPHWIGNSTDYLLTYLIYNIGWLSFILIIGALAFFIVRAGVACFKQKSILALLVSLSVLLTFTLQVIGYIISNLGVIGMMPISLPLISHSHIAVMINLVLIGIMLSAFRTGDVAKDDDILKIRSHRFITWRDRKLIISFDKK
jgi:cell division protein FtsW (lipid II flippase)